MIFQENHMNPE